MCTRTYNGPANQIRRHSELLSTVFVSRRVEFASPSFQCGGDYRPKEGGDLLRWTAHCAFGSILRFHGSDHRPWSYDNHTVRLDGRLGICAPAPSAAIPIAAC